MSARGMLSLLVAALLGAAAVAANSKVVNLRDSNFDKTLQEAGDRAVFVKFYAPWCGHCRKLSPVWDNLAETVETAAGEDEAAAASAPIIAKVDATQAPQLSKRFAIKGYPTLLLFQGGKQYKYSGARRAADLSRFANGGFKSAAPAELTPANPADADVTVLTDDTFDHDVQPVIGGAGEWFVMFHSPHCGHCKRMAPAWKQLGKQMRKERTGIRVAKLDATAHRTTSSRFQIAGFPTLVFFKGGRMYRYDGPRDTNAMFKWATETVATLEGVEVPEAASWWVAAFAQLEGYAQDVQVVLAKETAVAGGLFAGGFVVGMTMVIVIWMAAGCGDSAEWTEEQQQWIIQQLQAMQENGQLEQLTQELEEEGLAPEAEAGDAKQPDEPEGAKEQQPPTEANKAQEDEAQEDEEDEEEEAAKGMRKRNT